MQLGLYIHYPYCLRKCLYCDFNSAASTVGERESYPEVILQELELRRRALPVPVQAATLYFGGGTPSLMTPQQVGAIIDAAARHFALAPDAEITLEANPGTLTPQRLAGYRSAGVNRISLGVQAFEDRLLERLGRVHSRQEALDAYAAIRCAGFTNVSLDLMHSLPGQSLPQWRAALSQAVALAPEHISAYALSVEEGTPFDALYDAGELTLPDEEEAAAMFEATPQLLSAGGYQHYEISNFCRPGYEARHNSSYWNRTSYLGFGAGAHSFWNPDGLGERWRNADATGDYREAILQGELPQRDHESLTVEQAVAESFFLGLRVLSGIDLAQLEARYAREALESRLAEVARLEAAGTLVREGSVVRLAPQAVIIANQVFSSFL